MALLETHDLFHGYVLTVTPQGERLGGFRIYDGSISTLDGLLVNRFLSWFPPTRNTDLRHRIITSMADEDGAPIKTCIGSLKRAIIEAQKLSERSFGKIQKQRVEIISKGI